MTDNNLSTPRPMLKKVKRPISRMPQQPLSYNKNNEETNNLKNEAALSRQDKPTLQNPFSATSSNTNNVQDFNLDDVLDNDNLPSVDTMYQQEKRQPVFLEDEDEVANIYNPKRNAQLPDYLTRNVLLIIGAVLFFMGIVSGKLFFTESKVVRNGLQGVVFNPEVPKGRARCGVAERSQGCVLYIMNPQRQELNAKDFYDLASQMTGRQRFVIETGNMRYSNAKIRPGDIVQLNIPPL